MLPCACAALSASSSVAILGSVGGLACLALAFIRSSAARRRPASVLVSRLAI